MVAEIDERHAPWPYGMHEPGTFHAIASKTSLYRTAEIAAPDSIHQNTDFHTASVCVHQSFSKLLTNPVCPENIRAENNRCFRLPDGIYHDRIGIIPIVQNLHGVPAHQGALCKTTQHFCKRGQVPFHHLPVLGEEFAPFPGVMVDHLARPAMNTVDTEHQVKCGSKKWPDPTDANPRSARRRVAFVAQGMECDHNGKCPAKARQNEIQNRPVPHKTPWQTETVLFPRR